jgi:hypothetical protein
MGGRRCELAKLYKYEPKKCKVSSVPVECDGCGRVFGRVVHEPSQCVHKSMPLPEPGQHVTDNPPRWVCWRCMRRQNLDRLA